MVGRTSQRVDEQSNGCNGRRKDDREAIMESERRKARESNLKDIREMRIISI